jgi:hypothetical protein
LFTATLCAAALNFEIRSSNAGQARAASGSIQHIYCVAQKGDELSPATLLALIQNQPIVTPAWAETAATTHKAWPEEQFRSTAAQYNPARLRVPAAGGQQGGERKGQEPSWLVLSDWRERNAGVLCAAWERRPGLLTEYLLVFEEQVGVNFTIVCVIII